MKARITLVFLVTAIAVGCGQEPVQQVDLTGLPAEEQALIINESLEAHAAFKTASTSDAFQELEALKEEILSRVANNRISKADMRRATQARDIETISKLVGIPVDDLQSMNSRLMSALAQLSSQFAVVQDLEGQIGVNDIEVRLNSVMANYEIWMETTRTGVTPQVAAKELNLTYQAEEDVTCQYGPYTACLIAAGIAAGATGPAAVLTYGLGAYVCVCGFCEGGWVNWVCQ